VALTENENEDAGVPDFITARYAVGEPVTIPPPATKNWGWIYHQSWVQGDTLTVMWRRSRWHVRDSDLCQSCGKPFGTPWVAGAKYVCPCGMVYVSYVNEPKRRYDWKPEHSYGSA